MTNEFDEIIDELVTESLEHLDRIDQELAALKQGTSSPQQLAQLFRSFHTVAGSSDCVGFSQIASLAREAERVTAALRDGKRSGDGQTLQLLGSAADFLRSMFAEVQTTREESDWKIEPVVERLRQLHQESALSENR